MVIFLLRLLPLLQSFYYMIFLKFFFNFLIFQRMQLSIEEAQMDCRKMRNWGRKRCKEEEQLLCLEIEREFIWGQNLEVLIGFEEEVQKQSADSYKSWLFDEWLCRIYFYRIRSPIYFFPSCFTQIYTIFFFQRLSYNLYA